MDRDYRLSNSVDRPKVTSIRRQKSINSFYGLISASWRNMIFLDVTGRNDWSSTLAPGNNSYFYPSVSGSVILSDLLHIDTPMVNFLKVRASWANVGNDTSPYQLLNYYNNSSFTGGFNMPTNKANYNLKPENVESWEFGVEGRFFDSRLTFDVAFYNATTTNQIISVPVDITTGVYNTIVNAGEINNRGWEVSARIQPVRNKNIRWDMNFTWSRNRNKVVELAPNLDSWTIATGPRGEIRAVPGGSLGDLYGSGYEKAPKGFLRHGRRRIDDRRIGMGHRRFGRLSRTGFGIREPRQHAGRLEGGLDELDLLQEFPPELLVLGAMGRAGLLLHQRHAGLSG